MFTGNLRGSGIALASRRWPIHALSLDEYISVAQGRYVPLAELLVDDRHPGQEDAYYRMEVVAAVRRLLARLTLRERAVICLRFGIGGGDTHTLGKIGWMLGLSRERVRQLEGSAMAKLRHRLASVLHPSRDARRPGNRRSRFGRLAA
jgi:DNA-directed RNA polymerase sigma subunit (sigma70/sigma32)